MSKQIKLRCFLFFYGFESLNCRGGVFPLVELGWPHEFTADSVEDSSADLAHPRFSVLLMRCRGFTLSSSNKKVVSNDRRAFPDSI